MSHKGVIKIKNLRCTTCADSWVVPPILKEFQPCTVSWGHSMRIHQVIPSPQYETPPRWFQICVNSYMKETMVSGGCLILGGWDCEGSVIWSFPYIFWNSIKCSTHPILFTSQDPCSPSPRFWPPSLSPESGLDIGDLDLYICHLGGQICWEKNHEV